ncbi:MAG: hypothetical protein A2600_10285 [Candidatus Lambdaproteobacteria bacterium RIFOXYD1_FULL_56_27]|uniref:DUF3108 domain-containing protein n=1 Tax=Candidatus Lambdaproteobacteria bacterium RIFOXYD2_FULL_56_26 TaxID=1817773 RepID=A0A1F6GQL2_9PROT|nr:MAG: hypothetical protein A2557_09400 [Candidatus Lambdaproteobacteria bacterium RIFOXYD2_FULL_56_26]OGH04146.1 MAG: hypothetical protein A2426_02790 [Candidatus Lambdaproteobacteria bacterium RIFOXYC1_FULL_56_13]OGH06337.1 MAG: hypothetical protein A2600_10285 [Candidatus Lambdaproteobacteria bacterium RIFOXYD1_FULL_56_27]
MKKSLVAVFAIWSLCPSLEAQSFTSNLPLGLSLRYEHKNQKSQQVTGYSELTYRADNRGRVEERLKNRKPDGELFQEKFSLFSQRGELLEYREKDYRKQVEVTDLYRQGRIETRIKRGDFERQFTLDQAPQLVPFEVLTLYLESRLSDLVRDKSIQFTLYLPYLGLESPELTQIPVLAQLESLGPEKSPRGGKEEVAMILVMPSSPMLQMLLPPDKSQFRFGFFTKAPRLLYSFSEAQTLSVLKSVK